METEIERRETRLVAARKALAALSAGLAGLEILAEIEQAHAAVEAAERRLVGAHVPALAVRARQKLRKAKEAEQVILAAHGYESWLGLQLRRVDALFALPSPEDLKAADVEYRHALAAWQELAGDAAPPAEAALSLPASLPALLNAVLRSEPTRPAVA
ncbi:MAG: hypothetical protein ACRD0O_10180 [Acidimicrobiia bacterium]